MTNPEFLDGVVGKPDIENVSNDGIQVLF
jgi:hypothetical protein